MLIELRDINDETFGLNPDHIVTYHRIEGTDNYLLRTVVEDRTIDSGTMVYLHSIPTLSLSIIKLNEDELSRCKKQVSKMFPRLNPRIILSDKLNKTYFPKDTVQLDAEIIDSSETALTWKSSDENIATVDDNGLVTFISPGTIAVTASNPNIPVTGTCMLMDNVPVVTLWDKEMTLTVDSDMLENPSIGVRFSTPLNHDEINWSSSNSEVVSVDSLGRLSIHKPGEVYIEAELRGATDVCKVTIPEAKVSIVNTVNEHLYIEDVIELKVQLENLKYNNVVWESSDPSVARVDSGIVTTVSGGSVTIRASVHGIEAIQNIVVNTIEISTPEKLELEEGTSTPFAYHVIGSREEWISVNNTDPTVISYDPENGLVKGLKEGSASLIVRSRDVFKTCLVTVAKAIPPEPELEEVE